MDIVARRLDELDGTFARVNAVESTEDLVRVLSYTLRSLFDGLLSYSILLSDERGRPRLAARFGPPRPSPALGPGAPARIPDVAADAQARLALHAVRRGRTMIAPLLAGRTPVGFIEVEARPDRDFQAVDLQVLEGLAGVFALALQRLRGIAADQARISREVDLRAASEIQRRLMAQTLPASCGVKVDTRYLPALDVGGDFFEVADLGEEGVGATIGDVAGKGVSAALIMSRVSSDVRRELRTGASPARVLQSVNTVCTELGPETFVTATCICVNARRHTLTVANAGHLPLVVRRQDGTVFDCGTASGTPLGVMTCDYTEDRIQLVPNDIVLLMTDGLVDALGDGGDGTASREVKRIVRDAPHDPAAINTRILEAADAAPSHHGRDDVTLVALQLGAG